MENKKSKKMLATEIEIRESRASLEEINNRITMVGNYQPGTPDGTDAKKQSIEKLSQEYDKMKDQINTLARRLEVETVAFLSGADIDVDDTPAGPHEIPETKAS